MYKNLIITDNRTAVVAIVVCSEKVLLLKRNRLLLNWCPPCGRVEIGESLEEALRIEVLEETGLSYEKAKYVSYWEGRHFDKTIKSYLYVCKSRSNKVILSDEHSDFCWVDIKNIISWQPKTDFDLNCWQDWIENSLDD